LLRELLIYHINVNVTTTDTLVQTFVNLLQPRKLYVPKLFVVLSHRCSGTVDNSWFFSLFVRKSCRVYFPVLPVSCISATRILNNSQLRHC